MEDKIKISIVIPVYNVENYLEECLNSILNQTFKDFEVICIDDDSDDNSFKTLKKYQQQDNRIKVFQQNHKGAAEARNFGITRACGKYIQFLDSDDFFEPNMLEVLYNTAEKYGADTVVCSSRKVDNEGNVTETGNPNFPISIDIAPLETPFSWKDYKENIFSLFHVPPWNKLYLREMILENNIQFQNLTSCNDVYFGYISKIFSKITVIIDKELINYRYKREGSISKNRGEKNVNIIKACVAVKNFLKEQFLFEDLKTSFYKAVTCQFAGELVHSSEENQNIFFNTLKEFMPEDYGYFESKLKKDYITFEYIKDFIGDKKVFLWGASLFIRNILEKESEKYKNILGIIDRNQALWGTKLGNYEIYSPDKLAEIECEGILLTVFSGNENLYLDLKKYLKFKYNLEILPNIFEKEITFN